MNTKTKDQDYQNLSIEEKLGFIDNKMKSILENMGYKINKFKLKPKDPSEFLFFKEPNIIILKEDKIDDDKNYVKSLQYFLSIFNKEKAIFDNNKIIMIYLLPFPIHHLMTFIIQLSYFFPIEIYFPQTQIDEYNLKEIESLGDDEHNKGYLKIGNLEEAAKNKYIEKLNN